MLSRIVGVAVALALPSLVSAQAPVTQGNVAVHGKALRRRGEVVKPEDKDRDRDDRAKADKDPDRDHDDGRNPNAATPAVPAHGEGPATPAKPAFAPGRGHRPGGHRP